MPHSLMDGKKRGYRMKDLKELAGKTIKRASHVGDAYADQSNCGVQLEFTDGTTFGVDLVGSETIKCDGVLFQDDDDNNHKTLWRGIHRVQR